jgi:hypothetical protein
MKVDPVTPKQIQSYRSNISCKGTYKDSRIGIPDTIKEKVEAYQGHY